MSLFGSGCFEWMDGFYCPHFMSWAMSPVLLRTFGSHVSTSTRRSSPLTNCRSSRAHLPLSYLLFLSLSLIVVTLFCLSLMSSLKSPEREIKVVRPLYSVEVTETETAKFETEISESDIHATWKLRGEALHPSAVRPDPD